MGAESENSAPDSLRPFQQQPFARLPVRPSRPHPYYSSIAHDLTLDWASMGRARIHYREYGSGPPLLLIHGLMTSSYSWRYVLDQLGNHFRLIIPDLPGAGRSSAPVRRLSQQALATWIGEFQTALGIYGCAAVGNSLGAYLCMRHALDDPHAYSRLINIHSPAFPLPTYRALHAALLLPGAGSALGWWIRRAPDRWAYKNVHYYDDTLKSLEEAREYGQALTDVEGTRAFVGYLRDVMKPGDFAEFIASLAHRKSERQPFPTPLKLIYSRQDPLVPPYVGEKLWALLDGPPIEWLDRSSHFAHVDSPAEVSAIILDFFRSDGPVA